MNIYTRETLGLFDADEDDQADFVVFKFLHTHTIYNSCIFVYIYIYVTGNFAEQKSYGFKTV